MSDYLHQFKVKRTPCPNCKTGELKLRYQEVKGETFYWRECSDCKYKET